MDQLQRLLEIMARLRDPQSGCPWDIKQTFATIAPYTIEEAYEVADAIARDDLDELRDELGDLLLQVVFHAQMAREQQAFDFADVATAISDKLVRRHPHVFADTDYANEAEQHAHWEQLKAEERAAKGAASGEPETPPSAIDGVALSLPALTRAEKLQKRAAWVGFDWEQVDEVYAKVHEEIDEVREAAEESQDKLAEELGDLLFAVVNLTRHHRVDPEVALRAANDKFSRRFRAVEARLAADDIAMPEAGLERIDADWEAVKRAERESD